MVLGSAAADENHLSGAEAQLVTVVCSRAASRTAVSMSLAITRTGGVKLPNVSASVPQLTAATWVRIGSAARVLAASSLSTAIWGAA